MGGDHSSIRYRRAAHQNSGHQAIQVRGRAAHGMPREHDVDARASGVCNQGGHSRAVLGTGMEKIVGNIMEFRQDAAFLSCRYVRYAGQCDTDAAAVDGVTTAMAMPGLDEFSCDKGSCKE